MTLPLETVEKTGTHFSTQELLVAREKTLNAMEKIAASIQTGMKEEDAIELANQIQKDLGAEKFWHRSYVRFGKNTLKGYGEPSDPGIILKENDIYFLDIGPVWSQYEGDAGATYVKGNDPDMLQCKQDCFKVFELVKDYWKDTHSSGEALYSYAATVAEKMGWTLNMKIDGHRISDFPHHLYSKMGLGEFTEKPSSHLWVLEIQIRHPTREFGGFYEDVLF